jgi:WD40 repeat protein
VRAVAFGPDDRRVLTGSHDMTAGLWDATMGEPLTPPLRHSGEARVWDAATTTPIGPPLRHGTPLVAARFDDDDRGVRTVGRDGLQRLWPAVSPWRAAPSG